MADNSGSLGTGALLSSVDLGEEDCISCVKNTTTHIRFPYNE